MEFGDDTPLEEAVDRYLHRPRLAPRGLIEGSWLLPCALAAAFLTSFKPVLIGLPLLFLVFQTALSRLRLVSVSALPLGAAMLSFAPLVTLFHELPPVIRGHWVCGTAMMGARFLTMFAGVALSATILGFFLWVRGLARTMIVGAIACVTALGSLYLLLSTRPDNEAQALQSWEDPSKAWTLHEASVVTIADQAIEVAAPAALEANVPSELPRQRVCEVRLGGRERGGSKKTLFTFETASATCAIRVVSIAGKTGRLLLVFDDGRSMKSVYEGWLSTDLTRRDVYGPRSVPKSILGLGALLIVVGIFWTWRSLYAHKLRRSLVLITHKGDGSVSWQTEDSTKQDALAPALVHAVAESHWYAVAASRPKLLAELAYRGTLPTFEGKLYSTEDMQRLLDHVDGSLLAAAGTFAWAAALLINRS
jgi:hypothetical protein